MLKKNSKLYNHPDATSEEAKKEILAGLKMLDTIKNPIVSVFGSHIVPEGTKYYKHAEDAGFALGKKGYAVVTGGGPGIMYAANHGARRAGVPSIGIRASMIKNEKVDNAAFTHIAAYKYLFVRRLILGVKSEALIFYPGGFGTFNELFEYVVLIQTHMDDEVPIILVNKKYWAGMFKWIENTVIKEGMVGDAKKNMKLFHIVDDVSEVVSIIEKSRKKKK